MSKKPLPLHNAEPDVGPDDGRPHICLTGGWFSSRNVGDQAILLGMTDALSELGDPRYSVITAAPDKIEAEHGWPAFAPKKTPLKLVANLLSADALVFTGGTPFYNAAPHMTYYTTLAALAHARGIPVLVLGISLRTLGSRYCRFLMRRIARRADLLGAREVRTLQAFRDIAPQEKCVLAPDVATQLKPIGRKAAKKLLKKAGVDTSGPCVSICVRDFRADRKFQLHHYSRAYDEAALDRYQAAIQQAAEHLVRQHHCQVVFQPMHTVAPDDDRRLACEIQDAIADRGVRRRVHVIEEQHGPREMKGMLGQMQANIGVRFHSLVLATSMAVPSLAVAYAQKNHAWMRYVGLEDYSHDLAEVEPDLLCRQIDEMMAFRGRISKRLRMRNDQIDAQFAELLSRVREILAERRPHLRLASETTSAQESGRRSHTASRAA